jgi:hypothetical protein
MLGQSSPHFWDQNMVTVGIMQFTCYHTKLQCRFTSLPYDHFRFAELHNLYYSMQWHSLDREVHFGPWTKISFREKLIWTNPSHSFLKWPNTEPVPLASILIMLHKSLCHHLDICTTCIKMYGTRFMPTRSIHLTRHRMSRIYLHDNLQGFWKHNTTKSW